MAKLPQSLDKLVAEMTLAEKAGQLTMITGEWAATGPKATAHAMEAIRSGDAGNILNVWSPVAVREAQDVAVKESRLGVPLLIGFDVIHGHRTIFPVPLGEAASFDPDLWARTADAAANEAASDGIALTFAPMLDIARDPRWGRICEGPGEDPWVACEVARAKVKGFQGASFAATAKHMGAYGAALAGRDYASADVSPREMEDVQLPAFHTAVKAGVACVMPSFNDLAGIPATANRDLLQGVLRQRWGFEGVIISDYNATAELIAHGAAADLVEAAALAMRAGVDIDMMGEAYSKGLEGALRRGLVSMADIDKAVLRVLILKRNLGLFDDPYRGITSNTPGEVRFRPLAREAARKSIVLLKNESSILPLSAAGGALAVVGPLADAQDDMLGPWAGAGRPEDCVTFLAGIEQAFPGRRILYAPGTATAAAIDVARQAEAVILCVGETRNMSGEASSRGEPMLPEAQAGLAIALIETGKPLILVLSSGRPIILPKVVADGASAILATWFLGSEAGSALGDILSGAASPIGRLPVTWPASVGQIPIYYARRRTGRPADPAQHYSSKYLDIPVEPMFPFGYGLSYAQFAIGTPAANAAALRPGDTIEITCEVANTGTRAGATTLFLFIQDPVASVVQPILRLKRFTTVEAAPGGSVIARFTLSTDDLVFTGQDLRPRLENGRIDIVIGERAVENELKRVSVEVTGSQPHISPRSKEQLSTRS